MESIRTVTVIRKAMEDVYEFATTPVNWPCWHPASLSVSGSTDHSLELGEQVTEQFIVAGRRGEAVWTVVRREPPRVWSIEGASRGGNRATITYTLEPGPDGTTFRRDLVFTQFLPGFNWSAAGPIIEQESTEALRRLKAVLEGETGPA